MSRRSGSSHSSSGRAPERARSVLWRGSGDGAPSNARSASETADAAADGWVRHGTALPDWTDLETVKNRRRRESGGAFLEHVSTLRFALVILAIAGGFTLYVGHVHATTDLYNQLQRAQKENQQLHLKHNRLKGAYDRRTGPSVIYERARDLGLQESVTYGPPITVE